MNTDTRLPPLIEPVVVAPERREHQRHHRKRGEEQLLDEAHRLVVGSGAVVARHRHLDELRHLARDVVEELIGTDAKFGVTLGDIMFDDLSLFEANNALIALIGIPWYNVIGNHDIEVALPAVQWLIVQRLSGGDAAARARDLAR